MIHIENLVENIEYGDKKPAIKILVDNDFSKEIRIVFREGQEMKEHKTSFPIVVEIVRGAITFGVEGQPHHLSEGSLIALEPSIPHDLIATKDSIVRLTLHKSDQIKRVLEVIKE
nr:cupin domain-containing protein [Myroides oncorhynchi]